MEKDLKKIINKIIPVLKKNGIEKAGIFGSYARGDYNENSDIDILVEIEKKGFSLLDFIGIKLNIEDETGKSVDLVEYKTIKPLIKNEILKNEIRLL
jgi:hypothetical protein